MPFFTVCDHRYGARVKQTQHCAPMLAISLSVMLPGVLYERFLPHGPAVRIRRTSDDGVTPVTAVLEVARRAGTPREGVGTPPPLLHCEAPTEADAIASL